LHQFIQHCSSRNCHEQNETFVSFGERERDTHTYIYNINRLELFDIHLTYFLGAVNQQNFPSFSKGIGPSLAKVRTFFRCATWWISLGFQQSEICPTGGTGNGGTTHEAHRDLFGGPNGPGGQVDVAVGNGETRFLGRFNQGLKLW
jgi:hypothetical protein